MKPESKLVTVLKFQCKKFCFILIKGKEGGELLKVSEQWVTLKYYGRNVKGQIKKKDRWQ